jgi:uncharacterized protein YodC (DUF2158 family)
MAQNFKKGDVVILKSGGPLMTIHNLGQYTMAGVENGALCIWFDGPKRQEAVFDVEAIQHYSDD